MSYEFDREAVDEAQAYQLTPKQLLVIRSLVDEKLESLGDLGVKDHRVYYNAQSWAAVGTSEVTGSAHGSISRGDVFDIAARGDLTRTFTASFIWGSGMTGYGPRRYSEIIDGAAGRLNEMLEAASPTGCPDVTTAYTMLLGGPDAKRRVSPMTAPYARLAGFGPAFFTKFLYFTRRDALILDNVVANALHRLSGMPFLVDARGRSRLWSAYRYAVYLHWMDQASVGLGCAPDELELTLFDPPRTLPARKP